MVPAEGSAEPAAAVLTGVDTGEPAKTVPASEPARRCPGSIKGIGVRAAVAASSGVLAGPVVHLRVGARVTVQALLGLGVGPGVAEVRRVVGRRRLSLLIRRGPGGRLMVDGLEAGIVVDVQVRPPEAEVDEFTVGREIIGRPP